MAAGLICANGSKFNEIAAVGSLAASVFVCLCLCVPVANWSALNGRRVVFIIKSNARHNN